MDIYMYNAWFGDCFQIINEDSNLYVDFGVHRSSKIGHGMKRSMLHYKIVKDIENNDRELSLLVTHYHDDHISGLLYMINHDKKNHNINKWQFNKVYIPDIWNVEKARNIVALHLLEDLIRSYQVSESISLLDFVEFLCGSTCNVCFTHRGTVMEQNKYIALWPDPKIIGEEAVKFMREYQFINDNELVRYLLEASDRLIAVMKEREDVNVDYMETTSQNYVDRVVEIREYIQRIREMRILEEWSKNETFVGSLKDYANEISIVFQNYEDEKGSNILFTGDIESRHLKEIARNYDEDIKCNMYKTYDYIKVPHHGTHGRGTSQHYYDFSKYNPKVLMIPNGQCNTWKITHKYIQDGSYNKNAKVYCSNCNWCEGKKGVKKVTCKCTYCEIVYPKLKKRVLP